MQRRFLIEPGLLLSRLRLNHAGHTGLPMKRSTQVSLVVMAAAGIGAAAYALTPGDCRQSTAGTAREPKGPVQPTAATSPTGMTAREEESAVPPAAPDCRPHRGGSSGYNSSSYYFIGSGSHASGSSGATMPAANGTSAAPSASRGGFGSIGHALASFAGS